MDVSKLREFVTLVECGGFRIASQNLFISQSTLSRHIADLEMQCGHMLITRDKPVVLTPSGTVFEQYARRFITLHDRLERDLAYLKDDAPYRITVQDISSDEQLLDLLASMRKFLKKALIGASFEFVPLPSPSVADAVASHEVDIGVLEVFTHQEEPLMPSSSDIDFVMISATKQPLSAFCRRSGPFGKIACIAPQDLDSAHLVASSMLSPDDTARSFELIGAHLEKSGISPSFSVLELPLEEILARAGDNEVIIAGASTASLLLQKFHTVYSLKAFPLQGFRTGVCLAMRKNWKELAEKLRDAYQLF